MAKEIAPRPEIDSSIQGWLDSLAKRRERPLLLIVGELNGEIADLLRLYCWTSLRSHNKLSVMLHSPGGYPKSAYQMILTLRRYAEDIEVLVPAEAKSAATLFCLGANKIYMGPKGELGPLDMQIPDSRGNYHSTLESFKASDQLLEHAMLAMQRTTENMLPLPRQQRLMRSEGNYVRSSQAGSFMNSIVTNLYEGFDASELGRNSRYLSEMEEYAIRAIKRGNNLSDKNDDDIRNIAHKLVWDYPSHDFLIDLQEARELGINAAPLDDTDIAYDYIVSHLILEETCAADFDDLMDRTVDTFFGIGFPSVATDHDLSDSEEGTKSEETGDGRNSGE